jgi:hypothetical protein
MLRPTINGEVMNWSKLSAQVVVILFILCLNSLAVMLCWNEFLKPAINGVNEINFITAMGIIGLCGILFKDNGIKANFNE